MEHPVINVNIFVRELSFKAGLNSFWFHEIKATVYIGKRYPRFRWCISWNSYIVVENELIMQRNDEADY